MTTLGIDDYDGEQMTTIGLNDYMGEEMTTHWVVTLYIGEEMTQWRLHDYIEMTTLEMTTQTAYNELKMTKVESS